MLAPFSAEPLETPLTERARRYADCGYESLWAASSIGRGVFMIDPFVALAAAASVTEGLELGTSIVQVPLYHPADLAHRVLSLVEVCGDRFILGVGAGSTETDFEVLDRDYSARLRTLHDNLSLVRKLIKTGEGSGFSLNPIPTPAPRIFYGTWGSDIERAARDFDGWIASARFRNAEELRARLDRYREAGGQRAIVTTILVTAKTDLGALGERLQQYAEFGFDDAVIMFMPGAPDPEGVRALV